MKIMRVILFVVGVGLVLSLLSGCQESRKAVVEPEAIEVKKDIPKKVEPKPEPTPEVKPDTEQVTSVPILEVENAVFDFGTVGPSKKVDCEYKFKNAGTATLHIDKILSTCQCTVPELKKKDYQPGESGAIKVYYSSGISESKVLKHLHIISNDRGKKASRFELTIKGKVELKVEVLPKKLDLILNQENGGLKTLKLKSKDGKAFAIKSFSSTQSVITADYDPTVEKTEFDIPLKVDVEKLRQNMHGTVKIIISHPDTSQVNLAFLAPALYIVSPGRFVVRDAEPGKVVSRELWVKSNYFEDVDIESITSTKGYMKVVKQEEVEVVKEKERGKSVKLFVEITPPPQEGKTRRYLSDKLEIKLTDGEKLTVTMSGWYVLKSLR